MASASFVEVISHFAGYLQIFHDITRDRILYDESLAPRPPGDYITPRLNYDHPFTPDDLDTKGGPAPDLIPDDPAHFNRVHSIRALTDPLDLDLDFFPPSRGPNILLPTSAGSGGSGGVDFHIRVEYRPGGEQSQIEVHQRNILYDDDTLLQLNGGLAPSDLTLSLATNIAATIERMADAANGEIPQEWWIPQNGTGATDFLTAHDADWAASGGTPDAHSVQPGYDLNGVLQDPAPIAPDQTLIVEPAPLPDTGQGLGQWAVLGNNSSLNAALIIDLGESARTMIVNGDYFSTNAIFQTNTIIDHDHINVSDGPAPLAATGDDVTTNIADFVQHPGVYASIQATFAGPNWSVDVVDGNYYNVHILLQTNYLFDNDVVVQTSADTHYDLVDGYNQLGNLAQIFNGEIHYDLIVIEGAYHGMNVIFQNNLLLNNDQIYMAADGADPTQSVESGRNNLLNEAAIENYGGDNFGEITDGMKAILSALESGATSLDPSLGTAVDGTGGVFNVLYVTGDYYDINAVWQTNVTSDVNVIYQLQNQPSPGALTYFQDGTATQSVATGSDSLVNDAAIIDVGPTNTYVTGQVYTDTILVQADLLPSDQDQAVNADTQALIPELIAFVDDSQDDSCTTSATIPASVQADPIASVLQ
jgi:hypothetical protein